MPARLGLPPASGCTRRTASLRLAGLFAIATIGRVAAATEQPTTHTVVMKATAYSPATLHVRRGDTIVWVNEDPFPHTVTSAGAFDSGSIAAGASWKYVADRSGDHAYTCVFHPNMNATLHVR